MKTFYFPSIFFFLVFYNSLFYFSILNTKTKIKAMYDMYYFLVDGWLVVGIKAGCLTET